MVVTFSPSGVTTSLTPCTPGVCAAPVGSSAAADEHPSGQDCEERGRRHGNSLRRAGPLGTGDTTEHGPRRHPVHLWGRDLRSRRGRVMRRPAGVPSPSGPVASGHEAGWRHDCTGRRQRTSAAGRRRGPRRTPGRRHADGTRRGRRRRRPGHQRDGRTARQGHADRHHDQAAARGGAGRAPGRREPQPAARHPRRLHPRTGGGAGAGAPRGARAHHAAVHRGRDAVRRRAAHRPGPAGGLAGGCLPRHPDRAVRPADGRSRPARGHAAQGPARRARAGTATARAAASTSRGSGGTPRRRRRRWCR